MRGLSVSLKDTCCILALCIGIVRAGGRLRLNGVKTARSITVQNESGVKVDVFWINSQTKELGPSNSEGKGIAYGANIVIGSYASHAFEIQEMAPCKSKRCRKGYFTVNSNEDQIFTIKKNFSVEISDSKIEAKKQARKGLSESCPIDYSVQSTVSPLDQLDALSSCLESGIKDTVDARKRELSFQAEVRQTLGSRLSDYACLDSKLNTTKAIFNDTLVDGSESYHKQVLFSNDHDGQVSLMEDLLSTDEATLLLEKMDDDKTSFGDVPTLNPVIFRLNKFIRECSGALVELGELEKKSFRADVNCAPVTGKQSSSSESCRSLVVDMQQDDELVKDAHSTLLLFTGTGGSLHFTDIGVHVKPSPGAVLHLKYGQPDPSGKAGNIGEVKICFQGVIEEMIVIRSSLRER